MSASLQDDRTSVRTFDWLFAGLVAVVVVADVALAAAVFDPVAVALASIPVDYGLLRLGLTGLAAVAAIVGTVAAGLRSPPYAAVGLIALPAAFVYGVTGLLLPWNQLSFWLGQTLLELTVAVPLVGEHLARALFGGVTLGAATLGRAFFVHYGVVGLAAAGLVWSLLGHRTRRVVRAQLG